MVGGDPLTTKAETLGTIVKIAGFQIMAKAETEARSRRLTSVTIEGEATADVAIFPDWLEMRNLKLEVKADDAAPVTFTISADFAFLIAGSPLITFTATGEVQPSTKKTTLDFVWQNPLAEDAATRRLTDEDAAATVAANAAAAPVFDPFKNMLKTQLDGGTLSSLVPDSIDGGFVPQTDESVTVAYFAVNVPDLKPSSTIELTDVKVMFTIGKTSSEVAQPFTEAVQAKVESGIITAYHSTYAYRNAVEFDAITSGASPEEGKTGEEWITAYIDEKYPARRALAAAYVNTSDRAASGRALSEAPAEAPAEAEAEDDDSPVQQVACFHPAKDTVLCSGETLSELTATVEGKVAIGKETGRGFEATLGG